MKQEKYDVLVIGSGIGGLGVAALLAKDGYKTLVVEKMPLIGGRASSVNLHGFILPTGAVMAERGGIVEWLFNEVGAPFEEVDIAPFRFRIGGEDYQMPEKGGIKSLVYLIAGESEGEKIMKAIRRGFNWREPSDLMSVKDWLNQYTSSEKIIALFDGILSHGGENVDEMPAGEFIRHLKIMSRTSGGIPPRGTIGLMEELAGAFKNKGGELWTRCRTKRILVSDEIARGAIVEKDGSELEILAEVVISNAGPKQTVQLAGSENFDKGYLKEVSDLVPPPSIQFFIASDRPLFNHTGFYFTPDARRLRLLICPTLTCPQLAPPGKHWIEAVGYPPSLLGAWNPEEEIELILQDLRDNLPRFDEDAEILHVACFKDGWPSYHALQGAAIDPKTSVENLYNVGDGVAPKGYTGIAGCAKSAEIVADDVKQRIKPGV